MENNNTFNVLDMADAYAAEQDIDVDDLFKQPASTKEEEVIEESSAEVQTESEFVMKPIVKEETKESQSTITGPGKEKKQWTPDAELLKDLPESNTAPAIYDNDEIREGTINNFLENIADAEAQEHSVHAMDDLQRKQYHIEKIKVEFGIQHMQVPDGPFQARIMNAASDPNTESAMTGLKEIFAEIVEYHDDFILSWIDPSKNTNQEHAPAIMDLPPQPTQENVQPKQPEPIGVENTDPVSSPTTPSINSGEPVTETKIVIDKTNLPEIAWTNEEMDKIRKTRTVELNIVEDVTLKYTNIEDIDDNAIDIVLSQYQRKVNDTPGTLPASKYRATFTGLTYTEILDLSHSQEMNNIDGERKKWSIAFDHIKNQSIGPWESKDIFDDEGTLIRTATEFEDFLKKTSYMDLEFMLWKILCATAMEKEIISIDCHGTFKGSACGRSYDWIYSPRELLVMESINVEVLEEMKKTGEVSSKEEIEENYKSSMLHTSNTIELPTSKMGVVFGHISAYDYLNYVYPAIQDMQNQENPMLSEALSYTTLTVIKNFLIPEPDGSKTKRIKGVKQLIRVVNSLNEIDFQTISELVRIMIEPYQFRFELRNIQCPQCKTRSSIGIEDMTRLLFIVAQSLSSVQVTLKKT